MFDDSYFSEDSDPPDNEQEWWTERVSVALRESADVVVPVDTSSQTRENEEQPDTKEGEDEESEALPGQSRARNIDDCIGDLLYRIRSDLPRLDHGGGDTWVYMRPPHQEIDQTDTDYQAISDHYNRPFTASSEVLRASESKLILKQLDSPTQQFKICRRFEVKSKMEEHGIKFVIDLTPPLLDDEAVEITQELSCPAGVLNWVYEADLYNVSDQLVAGVDEFSSFSQKQAQKEARPSSPSATAGRHDYTPLRHRAAIERVLLALHGEDPKLDSAPKLYTTVMAAVKHLQIPAYCLSKLADYVVTWLRADPNHVFIELHPEVTLKIADALQSPLLCQDAFSILTGEAALEMACRYNENLHRPPGYTIHRRLRSEVDETWETRLQYARNSIAENLDRLVFTDILGGKMGWIENLECLKEIRRELVLWHNKEFCNAYAKLLEVLKNASKRLIYSLLISEFSQIPPVDAKFQKIQLKPQNIPFTRDPDAHSLSYREMTCRQRIFTRTFWKSLKSTQIKTSSSDARLLSWNDLSILEPTGYVVNRAQTFRKDEYKGMLQCSIFKETPDRAINEAWSELRDVVDEIRNQLRQVMADGNMIATSSVGDTDNEEQRKRKRAEGPTYAALPLRVCNPDGNSMVEEVPDRTSKVLDGVTSNDEAWRGISRFGFVNFSKEIFFSQLRSFLSVLASSVLRQQSNDETMSLLQIDTLLCLNDNETKYLPLWAGGMDDGSSGVFGGELPTMSEGEAFGPARSGLRRSTEEGSDFGDASTSVGQSTVATSRFVHDGHDTPMDRRKVYAADEVESVRFDDSASNTGTDSTWEGVERDDVSIGTSSDLAGTMERTHFGLSSSGGQSPAEESKSGAEDLFNLSDDDDDDNDNDDMMMDEDAESAVTVGEDSEFEVVDHEHIPEGRRASAKRSKTEDTRHMVARWARENPAEASATITYKERSQSPLVFEKS